MYQSWFEYHLSRPYPFRWFTWVVVVGGIVLTVLFSIVNISASGFYMRTTYTTDPNGTVSAPTPWFLRHPFNWGDNYRPFCEAQLLSVGQQFFTTNQGFYYTITSVTQYDETSGRTNSLPSVSYLNHTLSNCQVDQIIVNLLRVDTSPPSYTWWTWGPSNSVGIATCTIPSVNGLVNLTLSANYIPGGVENYNYVIQDNYTTHAPVWWGTRLMNAYFWGTIVMMAATFPQSNNTIWTKGVMTYASNASRSTENIRNLDFFDLSYYMIESNSNLYNDQPEPFYNIYNNLSWAYYSPPLTEGLFFSKIFYSLIRLDLGNSELPNLLLDEDSLQYILTPNNDDNRLAGSALNDTSGRLRYWRDYSALPPLEQVYVDTDKIVINQSYAQLRPHMGPLTTKPASLYSQYSCSVPQAKGLGTVILAVLISDLVFLSAAWRLLSTVSHMLVTRKDPDAMLCAGCARQRYQSVAMEPLSYKGQLSQISIDDAASTTGLIQSSNNNKLAWRPSSLVR